MSTLGCKQEFWLSLQLVLIPNTRSVIMSWLSSWLHPERGYQAAQDELNKYYQQGQGFQQPYNQFGQNQGNNINDMIRQLMDPQALQDKWSKNYKESEAAKNMEGMAQSHGMDIASAMGLNGSTPALQSIQAGTSAIGAADRQNYLNDLMDKYKTAAGLSQNMYNTGANTANNMANNAMNMGNQSAGLKFNETNAPGNVFGGLMGTGANSILQYLTGGYGQGGMGRGAWSTGGH